MIDSTSWNSIGQSGCVPFCARSGTERDGHGLGHSKKGDRPVCGNYRGISLLSIAGKIFARILLDRLLIVAEEVLPESQCGFRLSCGTTDMIFCARLFQEKSPEQR
ncbi:hypothetical protein Bbelb_017630 [Branchiostoma belcheri]|nr:hypothetical protein Bbelb_017630 [Branchiostoma belcheri]